MAFISEATAVKASAVSLPIDSNPSAKLLISVKAVITPYTGKMAAENVTRLRYYLIHVM